MQPTGIPVNQVKVIKEGSEKEMSKEDFSDLQNKPNIRLKQQENGSVKILTRRNG